MQKIHDEKNIIKSDESNLAEFLLRKCSVLSRGFEREEI